MMDRTLEVQWMINGYGGYTVHRYSIVLPSTVGLLFALGLVLYSIVIYGLVRAYRGR